MLPNEVLLEVLRWLLRQYLDVLEITSGLLNAVITNHLHELSLRCVRLHLDAMGVSLSRPGAVVIYDSDDILSFASIDSLGYILPRVSVKEIRFPAVFGNWALNATLPYADHFRKSVCYVSQKYEDTAQVLHAFSVLYPVREIRINCLEIAANREGARLGATFFEAPCIRRCAMMRFTDVDFFQQLVPGLADWLSAEGAKKRLALRLLVDVNRRCICCDLLTFEAVGRNLRKKFMKARVAVQYELIASIAIRQEHTVETGQSQCVNENTSEELIWSKDTYEDEGSRYLRSTLIRRPLTVGLTNRTDKGPLGT